MGIFVFPNPTEPSGHNAGTETVAPDRERTEEGKDERGEGGKEGEQSEGLTQEPCSGEVGAQGQGRRKERGRVLVEQGTRYRRNRVEKSRPKLLSWMDRKAIEKIAEEREKDGQVLKQKDPSWEQSVAPGSQGGRPGNWSSRNDRNVKVPLIAPIVTGVDESVDKTVEETPEDWWNALIREEDGDR